MLNLQCKVEIRSKSTNKLVTFDYANSIEVKTSCKNLTDTATVKVPRKMQWQGKSLLDYVRRNDEITIKMGYKEYGLETVFNGFVNTVSNDTPVVIECENRMRQFKTVTVKAEVIKNFNIKKFIQKYVPGMTVIGPDIDFGTVTIEEQNLSQCLDKLMGQFPWFKGFFRDDKFVAVTDLSSLNDNKVITLDPTRNLIKEDISYTEKDDVKIAIKAVSILRDNSKIEVVVPDEATAENSDYEQRQLYFPGYTDAASLKAAAQKQLDQYCCAKVEGTVTTFGVPFVRKCDIVRLRDEDRPEYNGDFWVEAVDHSFGNGGYRQKITLGYKLQHTTI